MEAVSDIDPAQSVALLGQILDGRYRVLELLGKGGMGTVYLAEHVLIRRKVALKVLHAELSSSHGAIRRFHREAVAAAAIGNEHIVSVTDMGRVPGGSYYLVLEYLEGADLAWTVASEGPLSIERAWQVALQVCDGLSAVHAAGILHRDLKPENVFLVQSTGKPEVAKILDFGICRFLEAASEDGKPGLTSTGVVLGTPNYMAPEQIDARSTLDARADVYAVGALLYFAFTGDPPFQAASIPGLFHRVCLEPAPDVRASRPEVPAAFAAIIQRALAKLPEERFASAAELRDALLKAHGSQSAVPHAATEPRLESYEGDARESPMFIPGKRRWAGWAAGAAVAVLGAVAGLSLWPAKTSLVRPVGQRARSLEVSVQPARAVTPRFVTQPVMVLELESSADPAREAGVAAPIAKPKSVVSMRKSAKVAVTPAQPTAADAAAATPAKAEVPIEAPQTPQPAAPYSVSHRSIIAVFDTSPHP